MSNSSFKDIEKLEADLWQAADNLCANSKLTSGDYFMPGAGSDLSPSRRQSP
jgi:type I restriction enzyme M protein